MTPAPDRESRTPQGKVETQPHRAQIGVDGRGRETRQGWSTNCNGQVRGLLPGDPHPPDRGDFHCLLHLVVGQPGLHELFHRQQERPFEERPHLLGDLKVADSTGLQVWPGNGLQTSTTITEFIQVPGI